MKKIPHIVLHYPNYFPESFGKFITSDIQNENLDLYIKSEEPQIWASLEWAIPGVISAYLLKPYFESFLKEAGKDHYNLLKKCLIKILTAGKEMAVKTIVSEQSPNKINSKNTQSKAISIHIQTKDNRIIKLLFDEKLSFDDWSKYLDIILNKVYDNYQNIEDNELTLELESLDKDPAFEIIAIINNKDQKWEFFDNKSMIEKIITKRKKS